jgi:excisionase family DNA binding protein
VVDQSQATYSLTPWRLSRFLNGLQIVTFSMSSIACFHIINKYIATCSAIPKQNQERIEKMQRLTTDEVAEELRVSAFTVRRYIEQGKLTAVKVGRRWLVQKEQVDRILAGA